MDTSQVAKGRLFCHQLLFIRTPFSCNCSLVQVEVVDVVALGGYEDHLLAAVESRRRHSERCLVTVLTRRAAEEVSAFFIAHGVKSAFIHSEVKQAERLEAIDGLRAGTIDVLVGCNLLREGVDLPGATWTKGACDVHHRGHFGHSSRISYLVFLSSATNGYSAPSHVDAFGTHP